MLTHMTSVLCPFKDTDKVSLKMHRVSKKSPHIEVSPNQTPNFTRRSGSLVAGSRGCMSVLSTLSGRPPTFTANGVVT